MSKSNNEINIYHVVAVFFVIAWVLGALGFTGNNVTKQDVINYNRSRPEYKAAERVANSHGYYGEDAETIADAVIQFHDAQQNR